MPIIKNARTFGPQDVQRGIAKAELNIFLEAISHDTQFAVRHACWLIEVLHLPERITRADSIEELAIKLALFREQLAQNPNQRWIGRPWTATQLKRIFYARQKGFRRPVPHPVTREELAAWTPLIPPAEMKRRARVAAAGPPKGAK